jgi:RHS repeat-associated protein
MGALQEIEKKATVTNSSATKTDGYSYDAFGAPTHSPGSSTQPFQFTGQQTDSDSGLQYLRARYYDPGTGRFLSKDPLPIDNRYSYVSNNPITMVDPLGLCGWTDPTDCVQEAVDQGEQAVKEVTKGGAEVATTTYNTAAHAVSSAANISAGRARALAAGGVLIFGGTTLIGIAGVCAFFETASADTGLGAAFLALDHYSSCITIGGIGILVTACGIDIVVTGVCQNPYKNDQRSTPAGSLSQADRVLRVAVNQPGQRSSEECALVKK